MRTKEKELLDKLKTAGIDLAPMLGGKLKPSNDAPMLGGDRRAPALGEILKAAGIRLDRIAVAGVTFEGRQALIAKLTGKELAHVVPEPENQYDPNALAVMVMIDGEPKKVGYIPRDLAEILAPVIAGRTVRVGIAEVLGGRGWNRGLRIE